MNYYIIPEPYKMEQLEGNFYFGYDTEVVLDSLCTEKEYAYAKINLYLDVLSKREDGFHEIESIMQTVSLADELTFTLTKK